MRPLRKATAMILALIGIIIGIIIGAVSTNVKHKRAIAALVKAQKSKLEEHWHEGFNDGWNSVLSDYFVMKNRIDELLDKARQQ